MPGIGIDKSPEYYRELKRRRDKYKAKLIAKGVNPRSNKMYELLNRKYP